MKIFKILILLNFCLLLFSCNTVKKGFTNQKKSSTDEFLVEKKSPLVQPPEYNELPIPSEGENLIVNEEEKVKKLLPPFLSSCLFCFSSFGTQRRRLSSNEQKKGKRE